MSREPLTLQSDHLRVVVRPTRGARIDRLHDRRRNEDWVYHAGLPGTTPLPLGAAFDENWHGGWDDVFPSDAPLLFQERQLTDHGELWSQAWTVREHDALGASLGYSCQTVPVDVGKRLRLDERSATLHLQWTFTNRAPDPVDFLFKFHPALAIAEGDEILMPLCEAEPVDLGFSTIVGAAGRMLWPTARNRAGETIDLRRVPARSAELQEFLYCRDLTAGWCGLRRAATGSTLRFHFDRRDFPYVWLFQAYGKWRDHYTLVMEPCTTMPWDLAKASAAGQIARLAPFGRRELSLTLTLA